MATEKLRAGEDAEEEEPEQEKRPGRKRGPQGAKAQAGKRQKQSDGPVVEPEQAFRGVFAKDLPHLMYAFGDSSQNPVPETVDALEDIAVEYVRDVLNKAMHHASVKQKIDHHDILFVIRKDARKSMRARELLRASDRIKEAKNDIDGKNLTGLEQYAKGPS